MLLPRPREHRHSYHGVLAANARLRKEVVARAGLPIDQPPKVNRGDGDTQPQPSDEQSKAGWSVSIFMSDRWDSSFGIPILILRAGG